AGVRAVIDLWSRLDVALFGIGGPSWSEASVGAEAMAEIRAGGAIGELLIAPFAADGRLVATTFRARTVACEAAARWGRGGTSGAAAGAARVAPTRGARGGGLGNTLGP